MNQRIADILCLLFIAVPVLLAAWLWPELPDPMPSHWNAAGDVDDTLPKAWGVSILPLAAIASWILMKVIPLVSSHDLKSGETAGVLRTLQVSLVGFLALVAVLVLLAAIGIDVHMTRVILAATGLLFVVIGSVLGKVRKNSFVGIRTPWTLANDEVWARTHRLGGRMFLLAGALMIAGSLFGLPLHWLIAGILLCSFYPLLYSYLLYRRLGTSSSGDGDRRD